jgi:hypothetical protein
MSDDLFFGSGRRQRHPSNPQMYLVGSKLQVFNGNAHHTKSGLIQSDLIQNKRGHIVSRRASNAGKSKNPRWIDAIKGATRKLKASGRKFTIKDIAHLAKKLYRPGPKRSASHKKKKTSMRRRKISSVIHKMPTRRRVSRRKRSSARARSPAVAWSSMPSHGSSPRRTSRRHKPKTPYSP